MADEQKPPNPIEDLRKGLGLLFRAAKTTLEKLPTGEIEDAVLTGAKEVGRAVENVTRSEEEQFLKKPGVRVASSPPEAKDGASPRGEAEKKADGEADAKGSGEPEKKDGG